MRQFRSFSGCAGFCGRWRAGGTLFLGLFLAVRAVAASVGLQVLPGEADQGPVTVFYPSTDQATVLRRGPFTLNVAWQGAPMPGNQRLVVISHGSGGSPWPQSDLAAALVQAGFVVAMPEHHGDNARDHRRVGPPSWKIRPLEVSETIDRLGSDPRFAGLFDARQVGVYGMSAGGLTALTLAGARWSPARFARHCDEHGEEDAVDCTGGMVHRNGWDGLKLALSRWYVDLRYGRDEDWQSHTDPRITAVVAAVPMAAPIDLESIRHPALAQPPALGLIEARRDEWLVPRFHIDPVREACGARCELLADLPDGGHSAVLSPWSDDIAMREDRFLVDPPGFQRETEVPAVYARIVDFFQRHLLAP